MFASKDLFFSKPSGYQISRSVRLRSSATAYLNRTFTTPTSNTKWTFSGWLKRGTLGSGTTNTILGSALGGASTYFVLWFSADSLAVLQVTSGATVANLITTQVFRDPSAWYHIAMVWDSGNATSSNRILLYVNGVQVTSFSTATYPSLNLACSFNQSGTNVIGYRNYASDLYFDGYLTEINFIDGQALTPSSFGQTNTITGVWQPIKYTGTYGTNGFYLNFSDNSNNTATTIGKDYSGNGNNWTPNNISVTAGVTYDSMLDVPTLFADGGNGRGNYAVWNAAAIGTDATLSAGNLNISYSSSTPFLATAATIGMQSGKWYWEIVITASSASPAQCIMGITTKSSPNEIGSYPGANANGWGYYTDGGAKYNNGTPTSYGASYTTNDVIGIAFDADAGTLVFYKNNTSQGTAFSSLTSGPYFPAIGDGSGGATHTAAANFGQRPFSYTPPTGFVALNTQNLPTPTISNGANYMAATTYTGTGSALTIANTVNGISFKPDFVWVKGRSGATDHALYDSVRGTTKDLVSNSTAAETTQATGLTAFGSTGFTVGALAKMNTNAATYVGWQWLAGTTSSSNINGSITSTVSVGATQGFSVVTYTGTGVAATVGHGLGVKPSMIILKNRSGVYDWPTWSQYLPNPTTQHFWLNATNAAQTSSSFNSTQPTSSVFNIGTTSEANGNTNNFVAYCFAAVAGYSAFGSYTGNGSADGPFVFLGFRPKFIMIKKSSAAGDSWYMKDTSRSPYNVGLESLLADTSGAESAGESWDALSNGIKLRTTSSGVNTSGATYIYAAFAENPLKYANAR